MKTALVVEDETAIRELICEILVDEGFRPVALGTAVDGLDYLQSHTADIAIFDVRTPGRLNGIELAQIVAERWPSLPVLLTSGYPGKGASLPSKVLFISKPWTVESFTHAVNDALTHPSF